MKKVLLFAMVIVLLGINISRESGHFSTGCKSAFGANAMQAQSWFFTIADEIDPFIRIISPAEGATNQAHDVPIVIEIGDNESGVDLPTAIITIEGTVYEYTSVPIADGYRITIDGINWGWNKRIDFGISVEDLAG